MINFIALRMNLLSLSPLKLQDNYLDQQIQTVTEKKMSEDNIKVGDIIFLKFNSKKMPSETWPCIGCSYEIDCKVIEVNGTPPTRYYKVITGMGIQLSVDDKFAVLPKNKYVEGDTPSFIAIIDNELCPKDTVFYFNNHYACNDFYGIYIHMSRFSEYLNKNYFGPLKPQKKYV
jgi:hypothetical protein